MPGVDLFLTAWGTHLETRRSSRCSPRRTSSRASVRRSRTRVRRSWCTSGASPCRCRRGRRRRSSCRRHRRGPPHTHRGHPEFRTVFLLVSRRSAPSPRAAPCLRRRPASPPKPRPGRPHRRCRTSCRCIRKPGRIARCTRPVRARKSRFDRPRRNEPLRGTNSTLPKDTRPPQYHRTSSRSAFRPARRRPPSPGSVPAAWRRGSLPRNRQLG
jgi:hypothetical protein